MRRSSGSDLERGRRRPARSGHEDDVAVSGPARKRLRQRETFFGVMAMLAAISLSCWPEAANNTMRARSATRTGRDRLRAWDSSTVRSSELNLMAGAIRIRNCLLHHKTRADL